MRTIGEGSLVPLWRVRLATSRVLLTTFTLIYVVSASMDAHEGTLELTSIDDVGDAQPFF